MVIRLSRETADKKFKMKLIEQYCVFSLTMIRLTKFRNK